MKEKCDGGGVVVVHPGGQHSLELARALHEGGLLRRYYTSLDPRGWPWRLLPRSALTGRLPTGIPGSLVHSLPWHELRARIAGLAANAEQRLELLHGRLRAFDRASAGQALEERPDVVVGFENGARELFHRARDMGVCTVLDAASVHHSAQPSANLGSEAFRHGVRAQKEEEVALANRIVVLSTYARDTYAAAGFDPARITVIPPGIRQATLAASPGALRDGFRLLFVGQVSRVKGIDLLLSAFSRLPLRDKRLLVVGPIGEPDALPRKLPPGVTLAGRLGGKDLASAYAGSDLFVLPSRGDGFGFVVGEAMAAGLPVVVSTATGAKDLVEEGASGWIVEAERDDLLCEVLTRAADERQRLAEMGGHAKRAVATYDWLNYGRRIRAFYGELCRAAAERGAD